MIRRPPRSTLFPTRRSSDLLVGMSFRNELGHSSFSRRQRIARRGSSGDSLQLRDRKSTRLNSSHVSISYAVFCLKKKKKKNPQTIDPSDLPTVQLTAVQIVS